MDRPAFTYTLAPDGDTWLARVVERPELSTDIPTASIDDARALVRDLIATTDGVPPDSIDVEIAR